MSFNDEEQWWFQDLEKKVFGPYRRRDMRAWYLDGHLDRSLLVSSDPTQGFFPIHEFYPDPQRSFLSHPLDPRHNQSSVGASHSQVSSRRPPPMPGVEEPHWYFIDGANQRQGPFTNAEMCQWYQQGYFEPSLMVCDNNLPLEQYGWKTIAQYYPDYASFVPFQKNPEPPRPKIKFPDKVPAPPRFEDHTKIYPSERGKKLAPLTLMDIFGNAV